MDNIKDLKCMVTGATGYVAGWLVKKLLDKGITVHAAVRDPENPKKVGHLLDLAENSPGTIKLFKSDLLVDGSYDEAMKDCTIVFHTASPFTSNYKDPQKDLVDPAVKGTNNVLQSAIRTPSVKKVVLTSSCAAIYTDAIDVESAPGGILTEGIWNTTASLDYQPYSYSKTMAEKKAWEIAESQSQWQLVSVNPSLVMGPPLNTRSITSESFTILKQMGDGTMRFGAPKMGIGLVDVRDVADAHIQAAFNDKAQGRYICSAHNTDFFEMTQALREKYDKNYPIAKSPMPKWILSLVGPLINKAMTRKFIRNNINVEWKADNSKIKNELGIRFRPLRETMEDAFQALIDEGIL